MSILEHLWDLNKHIADIVIKLAPNIKKGGLKTLDLFNCYV